MLEKKYFENICFAHGYPINVSYNNSPLNFPLHWHNYVEIILTLQDNVQYDANGHLQTLMKNDILFIWPGELHSLIHQPQPSYTLLLQFDYSLITTMKAFRDKQYLFQRFRIIHAGTNPQLAEQLTEKLILLKDFYYGNTSFKDASMCIQLYEFFIIFGNYLLNNSLFLTSEHESKNSEITQKMIDVCTYITKNCDKEFTLNDAAKYAGFSRYHFSRLFKEFTSTSYVDFITKERMHRAEELLTNSSLSITEVALQSGFNSISTFNRVFKQLKNRTPSEFKDLFQASHE